MGDSHQIMMIEVGLHRWSSCCVANLSEETKDKLDKHVRLQVRAGHEYRVLKSVQLRVDTKLTDKTQLVHVTLLPEAAKLTRSH